MTILIGLKESFRLGKMCCWKRRKKSNSELWIWIPLSPSLAIFYIILLRVSKKWVFAILSKWTKEQVVHMLLYCLEDVRGANQQILYDCQENDNLYKYYWLLMYTLSYFVLTALNPGSDWNVFDIGVEKEQYLSRLTF